MAYLIMKDRTLSVKESQTEIVALLRKDQFFSATQIKVIYSGEFPEEKRSEVESLIFINSNCICIIYE